MRGGLRGHLAHAGGDLPLRLGAQARRRVRAAGSFRIDVSLFAHDFFTVESAKLARHALETDRVVESTHDLEDQLPVEYVRQLGTTTVVCSPMSARGRWIGVILADRGETAEPMGDAERDLLWILGKTAALASMARVATRQELAIVGRRQRRPIKGIRADQYGPMILSSSAMNTTLINAVSPPNASASRRTRRSSGRPIACAAAPPRPPTT